MRSLKNSNLILALGILAAAIFWCLDATIDVVFFADDEDESILESIFSPHAHEIYMRGIVLFLFVIVSFFARNLLLAQERINRELNHHKTNLEDIVSIRTEQLEKLASIDDLTQLYNRRKFFELMEYEINRHSRYKHPLSIIMIDIDHFKSVNDKYGHQVGDEALQQVSNTLLSLIRSTDIFGRIGGEEFALVLPETDKQAAKEFAERIRVCIENEKFPHLERITICLGVTEFYDDDSLKSIMSRADIALYAAKESGRNKVVTA